MPFKLTAACFFILLGSISAKSQKIELGGVRKVTAHVEHTNNTYHCTVSFLPVHCFGSSLNRRMNQKKGRVYASKALAFFVGVRQGRVSIKHLSPKTQLKRKGRFVTLQYTADSVKAMDAPTPKEAAKKKQPPKTPSANQPKQKKEMSPHNANRQTIVTLDNDPSLLSYLTDYQTTLRDLKLLIESSINALSLKETNSQEDLDLSIAEVEASAQESLDQLSLKITEEKLLLSLEKKELGTSLEQARQQFLKKLTTKYVTFQSELKKKLDADAQKKSILKQIPPNN